MRIILLHLLPEPVPLSRLPVICNNSLIQFILHGLAVYTIAVVLFLVFKPLLYRPPSPLPESTTVQAPFIRSVLPVIDHYQHICLQYATLPRQYINKETIPFTVLDGHSAKIDDAYSVMCKIGEFWDEQNGLTEDPWEYERYRRRHKDSPVPDSAIDIWNLCHGANRRVDDVARSFHHFVYMIAYGLPLDAQTVFHDLGIRIGGRPYVHDSSPRCNSKRAYNETREKCEPMPVR